MRFKKKELEEAALEAIKKHGALTITDVTAYLPCSRETFYSKNLHKSDVIKRALEDQRIKTKAKLRKKWLEGQQPSTQIALYKLIGTPAEADRLNGVVREQTVNHALEKDLQSWKDLPLEVREKIADLLEEHQEQATNDNE
jgi:hypothetical protein